MMTSSPTSSTDVTFSMTVSPHTSLWAIQSPTLNVSARFTKPLVLCVKSLLMSSPYQCLKLVKGCAAPLKVSTTRNKARRRHITTDAINPILRIKDKNELSANRFRSGIDEMFSCLDGLIKKALLGLQRPTIDLDPAALHDNLTNERPNYGFIKDPANRPFVDHQDRLLYHVQSTEAIRIHFYDAIGRRVILNDQSVQAWIGI